MSARDDGGLAFPLHYSLKGESYHPGMSLRDWFAGEALAGLYACRELQMAVLHDQAAIGLGEFESHMSHAAYQAADAMLAERAKAEGKAP